MNKLVKIFILIALAAVSIPDSKAGQIIVMNSDDSGVGSLRKAIADAADGDTIKFDTDLTIYLSSELVLNKSVTIDGTGNAIVLDGQALDNAGTATDEGTRIISIKASGKDVVLKNLTFANGFYKATSGLDAGGAIGYRDGAATLIIDSCTFLNNYTNHREAGAIHIQTNNSQHITISNSIFTGNKALNNKNAGAITINGGSTAGTGLVKIENCMFNDNSADQGAGAVYFNQNSASDILVVSCTFDNNTALLKRGGAVMDLTGAKYYNCVFSNNKALGNESGGAIFNLWSMQDNQSIDLMNCIFYNNEAEKDGGAIYCDDRVSITNCTFYNNKADANEDGSGSGGALRVNDADKHKVFNSVFYKNYKGQQLETMTASGPTSVTLLNNAFDDFQNFNSSYDQSTWVELMNDPFKDAEQADFEIDNLTGASCLNSGNVTLVFADSLDADGDMNTTDQFETDFQGNVRVQLGEIDLGAYESAYPAFIDLTMVDFDLAEGLILNTTTQMEVSLNSSDGTDGDWMVCADNQTEADISLDGGFAIWVRQTAAVVNKRNIGNVPVWEERLQLAVETIPDTIVCLEATDKNIVEVATALVEAVKETIGFSVLLADASKHTGIDNSTGDLTYGQETVNDSLYLLITNENGVEEVVGLRVSIPRGNAYGLVETVKNILPDMLNPVEGIDNNIIDMLEAVATDAGFPDMEFEITDNTHLTEVGLTGDISFGNEEKSGVITFNIVNGSAIQSSTIEVIIPVAGDGVMLSEALNDLPGSIEVVEGWDSNIETVVEYLLDGLGYTNVNVNLKTSENEGVDAFGAITYGETIQTGDVIMTLSLGDYEIDYLVTVTVPAVIVNSVAEAEVTEVQIFTNRSKNIIIRSVTAIERVDLITVDGRVIRTEQGNGTVHTLITDNITGIYIVAVTDDTNRSFRSKIVLN